MKKESLLGILFGVGCLCMAFFMKAKEEQPGDIYVIVVLRVMFIAMALLVFKLTLMAHREAVKNQKLEIEYSLIENKQWDEVFEAVSKMTEIHIKAKVFLKENYTITKK